MSPSALHLSQFDPVGIFWPQTVVKQADEAVTSSTTLQDDNEIQFSILANTPYYFEMVIVFTVATGSATSDFKHAFALTAGAFSRGWRAYEGLGTTTAVAQQSLTADMTTAVVHASAGQNMTAIVRGWFEADTSTTLKWQWAQNASDSNTLTVKAGTLMTLRNMTLTSRLGSQGEVTGTDGWTADPATWTYASATTFTLTGDQTVKFSKGTRIKLTQTTVKYFVVTASSFSAGTTTVTITGGSDYTFANAAVSLPYYSYAASPQGYPDFFLYAPAVVGFSGSPTVLCGFSVIGRLCWVHYYVSGTSNATTLTIAVPITGSFPTGAAIEAVCFAVNNGTAGTSPGRLNISTGSPLTFFKDNSGAVWTASGTKTVQGEVFYNI